MATLPSYQEAVGRPDWLSLVAPYVAIRDYARLCLASHRCHAQFAPRLWNDPLTAARRLGLHPNYDRDWYFHFVSRHAKTVRRDTLKWVTSLDFRGFALGTSDFYTAASGRSVPETFRTFASLFPNLRSIQLDDHSEIYPAPIAKPGNSGALGADDFEPLLFLSIGGCRTELPASFFDSSYLSNLVYLDISDMAGSLWSALTQGSLRPSNLPNLRILKTRGREMDDLTAILLSSTFKDRLWSLDLSRNNLSNDMVTSLVFHNLPVFSLQSDEHFETEGKLVLAGNAGSDLYGSFKFIKESEQSGSFNHPDRYLVDAPAYYPHSDRPPQEAINMRSNGRTKIRSDHADDIRRALTGGVGELKPDVHDVHNLDLCHGHGGITHLCINENRLTILGLDRLLRLSQGHLEHLECDSVVLPINPSALPDWLSRGNTVVVEGVLGISHLFRPLISSNLRSLRIHHSLVTQIPTLVESNVTTLTSLWLAETFLREKAELAFPQPFVPDMNPRLQSLTLTRIPRYSAGPLVDKLLNFLRLAYRQEEAIRHATSSSRRSPSMLRGLRHIRLEFDRDPSEEITDLDAEALLASGMDDVPFFHGTDRLSAASPSSPPKHNDPPINQPLRGSPSAPEPPSRWPSLLDSTAQHVPHRGTWRGTPFEVPVWVGTGLPGPHPALNAYMANLARRSTPPTDVRPATPAQVAAGVPDGSYVFHEAWADVFSWEGVRRPGAGEEGAVMARDVVGELRGFRAGTRVRWRAGVGGEGEGHWTGRLEVVLGRGRGGGWT